MKLHTLPKGSQHGEDKNQENTDHDENKYDNEDKDEDEDNDKAHDEDKVHDEDKNQYAVYVDDDVDEQKDLDPVDPETIMIDEQGRKWKEILHNVSIREADDYFKNLGMEID